MFFELEIGGLKSSVAGRFDAGGDLIPPRLLRGGAAGEGHGDPVEKAGGVEVRPALRERELPADKIGSPAGGPGKYDEILRGRDRQD